MPLASNAIMVRYEVRGTVDEKQVLSNMVDRNHYCSTSSLPWGHTQSGIEIPQGPPTFQLDFDLQADPAKPGLSLVAFGYSKGMTSHSDPADDWIEANAGGKQWIGHGVERDPGFTISFTFAADAQSGSFIAHGLHPGSLGQPADMTSTVDVAGSWRCPLG